jgi:hypothetical protein
MKFRNFVTEAYRLSRHPIVIVLCISTLPAMGMGAFYAMDSGIEMLPFLTIAVIALLVIFLVKMFADFRAPFTHRKTPANFRAANPARPPIDSISTKEIVDGIMREAHRKSGRQSHNMMYSRLRNRKERGNLGGFLRD